MFQPSPDTSLTTCLHPMPVEAPLRPSPLSSPSNEQAHHKRLLRPCRYDCEQNDLVDEENCGSFNCELRIAVISHRATEAQSRSTQDRLYLSVLFSVSLCFCGSVANNRNPQ